MNLLSKKLKTLRNKRRLSACRLAKISGVSKSYLGYMESGEYTNPSQAILHKLSKALEVSTNYFFEDDPTYTFQEKDLLKKFKKLNTRDRKTIMHLVELLGSWK